MNTEQIDIENKIKKAVEELKPYLEVDGGGLEFVKWESETLTAEIRMLGNCKTCPMHLMTFRAGIERYILFEVPEVRRIEEVQ